MSRKRNPKWIFVRFHRDSRKFRVIERDYVVDGIKHICAPMISYGVMHLVNLPHPHFFHYQQVGRQGIFLEYLNSFTLHDSNIKINHLLDCVCISKPSRGEQISRGLPVKSHSGAFQMQTHCSVLPSSHKARFSLDKVSMPVAQNMRSWRAKFPGGKLQEKSFQRKERYLQAREVKVCEQHPMNKEKI